jgi:hypothetical protein
MQASPRNKMVTTGDERIKTPEAPREAQGAPRKRLRRYFFPHLGLSVEAESREEAEKIVAGRTHQ